MTTKQGRAFIEARCGFPHMICSLCVKETEISDVRISELRTKDTLCEHCGEAHRWSDYHRGLMSRSVLAANRESVSNLIIFPKHRAEEAR